MKFTIVTAILTLASLARAFPPSPVSPRVEGPGPVALEARACAASSCRCNGIAGLFCGNSAINPACTTGDVFQCNESGATCNFGVRTSCQQCNKLAC
ncbi:hypothetical protein B0H19DRAFT_1253943 [Mycena capillaripes]|nr:hypothetical protein B0H19DRAFT_1253943 [Mycena capillaripes]